MSPSSLAQNYEEASTVAGHFINSIDNLPNAVEHLLQEIKIKEQRCQELLKDVAHDQATYISSALKPVSSMLPGITFKSSMLSSPPPSTPDSSSTSKAHLPARISAAYAQIAVLNDEKVTLARSLIRLLTSTKSRLDADVLRVRVLQGESLSDTRDQTPIILPMAGQFRSSYPSAYPSSTSWMVKKVEKEREMTTGLGAVTQINESLVTAMQVDGSPSGQGYNKKRRITTNKSLKISSPAPTATFGATSSRSRVSRQTRIAQEEEDLDADADQDAEGEDGEEEDMTLYCFCHTQSYGDMIGCDNPDCPYQWFHISCVGVKHPFPDKWYCPECSSKTITVEKRKGRKK